MLCNEDFRKTKKAKYHLYYQHFNAIKYVTIIYNDSTPLSGKHLNTFQKYFSKPHLFPWKLKEKVEKKQEGCKLIDKATLNITSMNNKS